MFAQPQPSDDCKQTLVVVNMTSYAFSMELQARSVGVASRLAALVILYAFLVKTVLVFAAPMAPVGALAGKESSAFPGMILCLSSASAGQAPDGPATPVHDASCCLLHCQLQLAMLAPLVLAVLALRLRPAKQFWRPDVWRDDIRNAVAWRFQARGPPLSAI
ncbi:hypothetical protein GCM10019059_21670 [Camelimonas fluminis]|nr:hypothetical protein GCM10019059_21670 [Camelimonas fluminis]